MILKSKKKISINAFREIKKYIDCLQFYTIIYNDYYTIVFTNLYYNYNFFLNV